MKNRSLLRTPDFNQKRSIFVKRFTSCLSGAVYIFGKPKTREQAVHFVQIVHWNRKWFTIYKKYWCFLELTGFVPIMPDTLISLNRAHIGSNLTLSPNKWCNNFV